jgi:glyceraldehyde 3-phosphate dehydrogenase
VPTSTGAAIATTKVLPALEGTFDGVAVRGPIPVGSIADVVFVAKRETTVEEVNQIFRDEAASEQYAGILAASDEPLVSSDIVGDSHASIVDLEMTQVVGGNLVKVMSWYDNEWGFTSQMIREGLRIAETLESVDRNERPKLENRATLLYPPGHVKTKQWRTKWLDRSLTQDTRKSSAFRPRRSTS